MKTIKIFLASSEELDCKRSKGHRKKVSMRPKKR